MMIATISLLIALTLPPVSDHTTLDRDPTVRAAYTTKWAAWSRIYRDYASWRGERVLLPDTPLRLAAEYRPGDVLDVAALKAAGYTGVVLLVDPTDTVEHAAQSAMALRGAGLSVVIAYAPRGEDHRDTVYPEPGRLAMLLRRVAPHADALLIGWRRTSVHMLRQDRAYSAYLIASARTGNPRLPVIGEIYSGETNDSLANPAWRPATQIPEEAAAVMVVNYDRPNVDPRTAVALLRGRVTKLRTIFVARGMASGDALRNAGIRDIIELINYKE